MSHDKINVETISNCTFFSALTPQTRQVTQGVWEGLSIIAGRHLTAGLSHSWWLTRTQKLKEKHLIFTSRQPEISKLEKRYFMITVTTAQSLIDYFRGSKTNHILFCNFGNLCLQWSLDIIIFNLGVSVSH